MQNSIVYVEVQPEIVFDANGVFIAYRSGDQVFSRRMSRAFFRQFIENAIRALDADERIGPPCKIIAFPRQ